MKIKINKNVCIGCGACEAVCPKFFKLKDGKAVAVKSEVGDEDIGGCVGEARDSCPVSAIILS